MDGTYRNSYAEITYRVGVRRGGISWASLDGEGVPPGLAEDLLQEVTGTALEFLPGDDMQKAVQRAMEAAWRSILDV
ncbi:MAG TPA: hypothetical protein VF653_00995 [Methylomirabilota bacterium]